MILLAARARGDAGRERLWALVEHGHPPWPRRAAVALAALSTDPRQADLEGTLLRCLEEGPDVEVVEALGRIGSVRAVPVLRASGGAGAAWAVAAIQGRAVGVPGGLALVDPGGGELAEVDPEDRTGALTSTDEPL